MGFFFFIVQLFLDSHDHHDHDGHSKKEEEDFFADCHGEFNDHSQNNNNFLAGNDAAESKVSSRVHVTTTQLTSGLVCFKMHLLANLFQEHLIDSELTVCFFSS